MLTISSIVLYVEDIKASQNFYQDLFDCKATELSPTFVSFNLGSGSMLTLKQRAQVIPPSDMTGGGTELSLAASDKESLMHLYQTWGTQGVTFLQPPTEFIFGIAFVALDPDNHRIRVFAQ